MISSKKGSEYNVAWNHLRFLENHHDISLVFGTNGSKIGEIVEDPQLFEKSNSKKIFIPSDLIIEILNAPNTFGVFKYSFYWAYRRWQKKAFNYCKDNYIFDKVDLIHFLNPIGFREPGFWYLSGKPLLWGPIGGFPDIPNYGKKISLKEYLLNTINKVQRSNSRVKKTIKTAKQVYAATTENKSIIDSYYGVESIYIPENGVEPGLLNLDSERFINPKKFEVVWIGSSERRKQLHLMIQVIENSKRDDIYYHLIGVEEDHKLKKLENVKFYSKIDRDKVLGIIDKCHLHVMTSLREGNPTVIWETAARGVPTLALNNSGMKDTVSRGLGIIVSNDINYQELETAVSSILEKNRILEIHNSLKKKVKEFSWERRTEFWNSEYSRIIGQTDEKIL